MPFGRVSSNLTGVDFLILEMNHDFFLSPEYPFVLRFAHQHLSFRLPELFSLLELFEVSDLVKIPSDLSFLEYCPFLPIGGIPLDVLKQIVSRSILIRDLYQNYCYSSSVDDLIVDVEKSCTIREMLAPLSTSSFKFTFDTFGSTLSAEQQMAIINRFSFLPLKGPIKLQDPDETFVVFGCLSSKTWNFDPEIWLFGRLMAQSSRYLVDVFDLKKRSYIGITSMNAELSLIMSNMALIKKGSFFFDPFVGTGSFLLTGAYFGGLALGCDIDGRQIRGKGHSDIKSNARQYNVSSNILGAFICDITRNPLRCDLEIFDAIITDPPYGVRAGAKKITPLSSLLVSKVADCMKPVYPKTAPYPTSQVYADLVDFSAVRLVVGGRVVFWIPSTDEDSSGAELDVPAHPCMKLVAKSEQKLNTWSRWLITMQKIASPSSLPNPPACEVEPRFFRTEYFRSPN